MDKWELVVTHPYGLAALGLSLLFYFIAARRRGWQESRLVNYIFGVLAAAVLVGGLALARREIVKPRPKAMVEPRIGGVSSTAPTKPPARPSAGPPASTHRQRPAVAATGAEAKGAVPAGAEEPKSRESK